MENTNSKKVLALRTCASDMSAYGGFVWPRSGLVEAPDWNPRAECGNGLHGLKWGEGSAGYLSDDDDANWMVCEVEETEIIDLGDKVKFPKANVVFCGEKQDAITYLIENGGRGYAVVHSTLTGGNRSTLTGGNRSTLTGGDDSTLTGGYGSTLTGGNRSTLTGGYGSTLTGGKNSTLIVKRWNGKRYKFHIAYVGEDGIMPGVKYRLNDSDNFVEVE